MKIDLKELALELYDIGAVKYGNFTTKVGLQTPIYIDLRVIISYPNLLHRISESLFSLVDKKDFDHVCGVPYTALPIATVISTESNLPMIIRRKEAKSYGTKKMIEGVFKDGDTAVIVEDIITSGSSVIETVKDLQNEGLKVNTALVIVDREQGGKQNLENAGITVKNLFTITNLIGYLQEAGRLSEAEVKVVKDYIASVKAPLKIMDCEKKRLTQAFLSRAKMTKNAAAAKLFRLMSEKQTTLCLAADFTKTQDIIDLANVAGPHIAVLKIHVDIIDDFDKNFIQQIKSIATKYNFLIMEDRKFGDIGQTVAYQYRNGIYNIAEWADLITVHPVPGKGVLQGIKSGLHGISEDRGVFIIAEMSSEGALTTGNYVTSAVSDTKDSDITAGYVCQNNIFDDAGLIQLTPGVQLAKATDNLGQQYNTPKDVVKNGADLIVVGRGITKANDKLSAVLEYKKVLWEAYEARISQQ